MTQWRLEALAGFTLEAVLAEHLATTMSVLWAADVKRSNGKGPRMRNSGRGVILADFLVAGIPIRGFIECKAKTGYGRRIDKNRPEQMIDRSAWDSYIELLDTGTNVYLMFLEAETHGILVGDMQTIRASGDPQPDNFNGVDVMRFDRRSLTPVGNWAVPDGDLRGTVFNINWEKLRNLMHQLPLEYARQPIRNQP